MGVRQRLVVAAAAAALVLPAGLSLPAQAVDIDIVVVHAIPGAVVDVYADIGDGAVRLIDDFAFDGENNPFPLTLPAGEAEITIVDGAADENDLSDPLIGPETVRVPGSPISLVAFVGADGVQLVLKTFAELIQPICTGNGALMFRHVAGAATTDVSLDGEVPTLLANVNPGGEAWDQVSAGTYEAELLLSGDGSLLFGPFDLEITAGVVTVVYAVGASNEELELLIVEYDVGETDLHDCAVETVPPTPIPTPGKPVPTAVPAGHGTEGPGPSVAVGALGLFLLAGVGVTAAVARARRQET